MDIWKILLRKAYEEATKSPDPSTQNGAVIVRNSEKTIVGTDCNRLPDGIVHTHERLFTPLKYLYVEHAEFGSVFDAMNKSGLGNLIGHTIVCPWAACTGCAKTIMRSGILRLVRHKDATDRSAGNTKWIDEIREADVMMREKGIEIIDVVGPLGAPQIRHGGTYWTP